MKIYKHALLLLAVLAALYLAFGHRWSTRINQRHDLEVFSGALGENLEHDLRLSIQQNPHGEADRAFFSLDGKHLGVMFATAPPPSGPAEVFRDSGMDHIKKMYSATSVAYSRWINRHGCAFDHFSASTYDQGKPYRYEIYCYEHEAKPPPASLETASASELNDLYMRKMFGMHKFEFAIPPEDAEAVLPLIREMMDSFHLEPRR